MVRDGVMVRSISPPAETDLFHKSVSVYYRTSYTSSIYVFPLNDMLWRLQNSHPHRRNTPSWAWGYLWAYGMVSEAVLPGRQASQGLSMVDPLFSVHGYMTSFILNCRIPNLLYQGLPCFVNNCFKLTVDFLWLCYHMVKHLRPKIFLNEGQLDNEQLETFPPALRTIMTDFEPSSPGSEFSYEGTGALWRTGSIPIMKDQLTEQLNISVCWKWGKNHIRSGSPHPDAATPGRNA